MSETVADQLRAALSRFPQDSVERFIERLRTLEAFSALRSAPATRRTRIAALQKAAAATKAFRECLEECIPYLDAESEALPSAAPFAELAEQAGGVDRFVEQLADGWRPPAPADPQLEDAMARGAVDEMASILKGREPNPSDLHAAWVQASLGAAALSSALVDEIDATPPPRRGPQRAAAAAAMVRMLADVAASFEVCFGQKPTKYHEGPFFRVAQVLTGLEDPSRQVKSALPLTG